MTLFFVSVQNCHLITDQTELILFFSSRYLSIDCIHHLQRHAIPFASQSFFFEHNSHNNRKKINEFTRGCSGWYI